MLGRSRISPETKWIRINSRVESPCWRGILRGTNEIHQSPTNLKLLFPAAPDNDDSRYRLCLYRLWVR